MVKRKSVPNNTPFDNFRYRDVPAKVYPMGNMIEREGEYNFQIATNDKFDAIDYKQVSEDVFPFIKDSSKMDLWSADFFQQITESLTE